MTQTTPLDLAQALDSPELTVDELRQVRRQVYIDKSLYRDAEHQLPAWAEAGAPALRRAALMWILNRHNALAALDTGSSPLGALLKAQSLAALGRFQEATAQLPAAEPLAPHAQLLEADILREQGEPDKALKVLDRLAKKHDGAAELHYQRGLALDAEGEYAAARAAYEHALELDPQHGPSLFRLAYMTDLHGRADEALTLYERCAEIQPLHVNCLLNLGILYDDRDQFEEAIECFDKILETNPNHERARLFRKDSMASLDMYFDEDQARRADRQNLIMSIPVTDFELSVRSRNCLNKMNIRTLGDLVEKTEAELLSYKNFGETSLMEIKEILAKKGLRLGMGREAASARGRRSVAEQLLGPSVVVATNPDAIRPLTDFDLSVRVRTAFKNLGISTLGDLTTKSSRELLTCKNFGQTSLEEVRKLLLDHGMSLADEPNPGTTYSS